MATDAEAEEQQQNRIVCEQFGRKRELRERERGRAGTGGNWKLRTENFAARHKRSMRMKEEWERDVNKRKVEKCMQISIAGLGQIPRQVPDACLTD